MTSFDPDEPLLADGSAVPPGALEVPPPPDALRDAILARTLRHVRARRWRRHGLMAAAAVVLFVAGGLAGAAFGPSRETPSSDPVAVARAGSRELPTDPGAVAARFADAPAAERARALRRAGDDHLAGARSDPVAALRFYRRALEEGDVAPRSDDSWLMLYLKTTVRGDDR